jgi:hypothetical protein
MHRKQSAVATRSINEVERQPRVELTSKPP